MFNKLARLPQARHGRRQPPPGKGWWPLGRPRWPCKPWRRASSVARWAGSATSAQKAERQSLSRRLTPACAVGTRMSAADQPLLDGRTQWHRLSAPVKQPACTDTCVRLPTAFGASRSRQQLASPSRVRWSSAVDSAVELACTGLAHKARAALSGLSGRRHGRWCRVLAPSSSRRSGLGSRVTALG